MDALRPGHAHRSSSDRLLSNYLESQKHLTTSLLTLLSHSHSSTSSLLAYVTSSPGVSAPIRRAVRHSAFEGPLSAAHDGSHGGSQSGLGDLGAPGWAAYIGSLEQFRKDLKQIHMLEEEISRVKRDREILVTRLIKTTKARPTKNDIKGIATSYANGAGGRDSVMSSQASTYSYNSDQSGGASGKESKRAGKLAEAQAELLGCEEHLRGLEVRIEEERNNVMHRGLEERFHAMEVVGQMWAAQARKGIDDLERLAAGELPPNAYELDSNGSLAPSQSASQVGYEDGTVPSPKRGNFPRHAPLVAGSITGSIAEEDEDGSSGDDIPRHLVMHENRPAGSHSRSAAAGAVAPNGVGSRTAPAKPSPLGAQPVNQRHSRSVSAYEADSDSDDGPPPVVRRTSAGRRAASDVGAMASRPPNGRSPLTRTFSAQGPTRRVGGGSDSGSIRGKKKKGGFSRFLAKLFGGGSSKRSTSGRDSPPYGSGQAGGWQTRTDGNIKRASTVQSRRGGGRGGDDSSSEDDMANLVSVSNNRDSTWTVQSVGLIPNPPVKRSASAAAGSVKKTTRSDLGSGMRSSGSQSTVTARAVSAPRATSPAMSGTKTPTPGAVGASTVSRSNTVRSTASASTARSGGKTKAAGGTGGKKTTAAGSRAAAVGSQQAAEGRNIMSLIDQPPPVMPEVAKAPKSTVTPQMELAKAPGSSIVPSANTTLVLPSQLAAGQLAPSDEVHPHQSISRSNSLRTYKAAPTQPDSPGQPQRAVSPLPPSKSLSPPLKSAMRSTSPIPPPIDIPTSMYSVTAPGPVELPVEPTPAVSVPVAPVSADVTRGASLDITRPPNSKRNSYQSIATTTGDEASIYESAVEEGGAGGGVYGYGHDDDEDTSDEDTQVRGYSVVENDRIAKRNEIAAVAGEGRGGDDDDAASDHTATGEAPPLSASGAGEKLLPPPPLTATLSDSGSKVSRRKSVRMNVPDSPNASVHNISPSPSAPAPAITTLHSAAAYSAPSGNTTAGAEIARENSPPPTRPTEANWDTRIGRVREDSSDEEAPRDEDYARARRGLLRNSGKWEYADIPAGAAGAGAGTGTGKKLKKGSSKGGSVRSKSSRA